MVLAIWASVSFAHSLGHDEHHSKPSRAQIDGEVTHRDAEPAPARKNVMELISAYSLEGDDRLIELGWEIVTPALERPTPEVWLQAAWLAQAEHRFALARKYVHQVTSVQPRNAQAWLLEAAVATVQGDYVSARTACRKTALSVAPVVSLACQLRATQNPAKRVLLTRRVSTLPLDGLDDSMAAWVLSILGDAHRAASNLTEARLAYGRSFSMHPTVQTRAVLADVLIEQRRFQEAMPLLQGARQVPAIGVRYLRAAQEAGLSVDDERAHLDERFRRWIADSDYRHAREMAMFYLDVYPDISLAYKLAVENLRSQSEPEDVSLMQRAANRRVDEF